jgi:hypothetical protein
MVCLFRIPSYLFIIIWEPLNLLLNAGGSVMSLFNGGGGLIIIIIIIILYLTYLLHSDLLEKCV